MNISFSSRAGWPSSRWRHAIGIKRKYPSRNLQPRVGAFLGEAPLARQHTGVVGVARLKPSPHFPGVELGNFVIVLFHPFQSIQDFQQLAGTNECERFI